jgi:hypothetical protein
MNPEHANQKREELKTALEKSKRSELFWTCCGLFGVIAPLAFSAAGPLLKSLSPEQLNALMNYSIMPGSGFFMVAAGISLRKLKARSEDLSKQLQDYSTAS